MSIEELEQRIMELRSHPLLLVCRARNGKERLMSVKECAETGSAYIHVAADELDVLLSNELSRE